LCQSLGPTSSVASLTDFVKEPATTPAPTFFHLSKKDQEVYRAHQQRGDPVHRPAHYARGGLETIDFIDRALDGYSDGRMAHYVGCAMKYLDRAPHKGKLQQDLEKAEWYLRRAINRAASLAGGPKPPPPQDTGGVAIKDGWPNGR
jgi:hypothetical protein